MGRLIRLRSWVNACTSNPSPSAPVRMQGLSNLAWALAVAGVRPTGAWLSEFWHELEEQLEHLNAKDVAHVFWWVVLADTHLMPCQCA